MGRRRRRPTPPRSASRSITWCLSRFTRIVPKLRPRRKEKSSIPKATTEPAAGVGRSMMRRKTVIHELEMPRRAASRAPRLPLVDTPMAWTASQSLFVIFAQGSTKFGRRSVKIFRLQSPLRQKNFRTVRRSRMFRPPHGKSRTLRR